MPRPEPVRPAVDRGLRELAGERPLALRVAGDCMLPAVGDGEQVSVAPSRLYWPGDVLVFRRADGRLVLHRLIGWRVHQRRLRPVTQADGAPFTDAPIARRQLLGKLVGEGRPTVTAGDRLRALGRFGAAVLRRLRRLSG